MTRTLKYIVYKEGNYFVSQCLNVDASSFGDSLQDAIDNLNEALELYFEDKGASSSEILKHWDTETIRAIRTQFV